MKTRIFLGLLLLAALLVIYTNFKDYLSSVAFLQAKYIDIATIILSSLIITYVITKIIDLIMLKVFHKFLKRDGIAKKFLPVIHNLIVIFVWGLSIITTISVLGFNLNTILTGAGIGGVLIALAGKEMASNLFGSLSLVFSKSFKIGDYIRIKNLEGTVEEITLGYTKLIDKKSNIIYIPNKNIITESIENLTQGKSRKNEINLPMPLNMSAKDLEDFLAELVGFADNMKNSAKIEEYKVFFDSFTGVNHNIVFQYKFFSKNDSLSLKSEISLGIKKIFDKKKIIFS